MNRVFYTFYKAKILSDEPPGPGTLSIEVSPPEFRNKTLLTALQESAKKYALASESKLGLLLDESYESLLTFLAFHKAGLDFSIYMLSFKQLNAPDQSATYKYILSAGYKINFIPFDFENTTNLLELEKLLGYTLSQDFNSLFQIWCSRQIDDETLVPGHFVTPLFNKNNRFYSWSLLGANELSLYNFFSEFGGIPSFLNSTPDIIYSQMNCRTNHVFRYICENYERSLLQKSPKFRKFLFDEFSNSELTWFFEGRQRKAKYKSALANCSRLIKENFSVLENRMKSHRRYPLTQQRVTTPDKISDPSLKIEKSFDSLLKESRNSIMTGSAFEIDSDADNKSYALFPQLASVHFYKKNLSSALDYIKKQEFFGNFNNSSTRTDLHLRPELADLVLFFQLSIEYYLDQKSYSYDDYEIVQCWANKSEVGQAHHPHVHPNSLISGIFYLSDDGDGNTVFISNKNNHFAINTYSNSPWSSILVETQPKLGKLVLFPSTLEHQTHAHTDKNSPRYSIAFNVMLRGELGELTSAAWLNL